MGTFVALLMIGVAMPILPLHLHQGLGVSTFVVGISMALGRVRVTGLRYSLVYHGFGRGVAANVTENRGLVNGGLHRVSGRGAWLAGPAPG